MKLLQMQSLIVNRSKCLGTFLSERPGTYGGTGGELPQCHGLTFPLFPEEPGAFLSNLRSKGVSLTSLESHHNLI